MTSGRSKTLRKNLGLPPPNKLRTRKAASDAGIRDRPSADAGAAGEKAASLVQSIKTVIEQEIILGQLKPGDDLNSVALSRRLATSRASVREALLGLANEGMVKIEQGKRPRVSLLTAEHVREVYAVRTHLLALAADLLVQRITDEDLAALSVVKDDIVAAIRSRDSARLALAGARMADEIARRSGNTILEGLVKSLRPQQARILNYATATFPADDAMINDNLRLLRAFAERDAGLVKALVHSMTMDTVKRFEAAEKKSTALRTREKPAEPAEMTVGHRDRWIVDPDRGPNSIEPATKCRSV